MRVCILGSGLSSLTLAKALVNKKVYVDLLNSKKTQNLNKSRTIGISKSNIDFFNNNIININKIIWRLKKIHIYSENLKNEKLLDFENNNDQLFSIIKNFELFEILEKSLKKDKFFKKLNIRSNLKFFENYNFVINTDYFNPLTKKYFNKKITKKYNSFAYTLIIDHQKILNNTAIQIFTKIGPLAFLPISNNKTSIVYSVNNLKYRKGFNIKELVKRHNFKYKIKKFNKVEAFELNSMSLRSYYHNKFLAFGDLLHRVHPLAGQGFNMTIRDIKLLLEIINNKNNLGLPLDYSVNVEFEKKIKHANFIFENGIDLIYEIFNMERKINNDIFSKSIKFFGNYHPVNKMFTKIADKGLLF